VFDEVVYPKDAEERGAADVRLESFDRRVVKAYAGLRPSHGRSRCYRQFPVPIYEYRCPNGHVFERFQSMSAPAPEKCDICGAAPLELVLYPVAIHYKGSGFYSTDYGKGKAKKDGDGGGGADTSKSDSSKSDTSKPASTEKKAAASGDS